MSTTSVSAVDVARQVGGCEGSGAQQRLFLEGVASPVRTLLKARNRQGMTVAQRLPFLRLQTLVYDEQRRPARLAGVSLAMNDGMPHLVLDLVYEPSAASPRCYTVDHAPARVTTDSAPRAAYEQTLVFRTHVGQPGEPSRGTTLTANKWRGLSVVRTAAAWAWANVVRSVQRCFMERAWLARMRRAQSH